MKREEIELIIMLKVSESLDITLEEVRDSINSKNKHTIDVLKRLGIEKTKHEKIIGDYFKMTKGLHAPTPVMVEYSKEKQCVDIIDNLIKKTEFNFKRCRK